MSSFEEKKIFRTYENSYLRCVSAHIHTVDIGCLTDLFGCWSPEAGSRQPVPGYLFGPFEFCTVFKHYLFKSKLKFINKTYFGENVVDVGS